MKRLRRMVLYALAALLLLCGIASLAAVLSNQTLPSPPSVTNQLSELDKVRLAETLHLRQQLGEEVWSGWGTADIPIIIWNRDYSFLRGFGSQPPSWEVVPDDTFQGQPYWRQPTADSQNFAVEVDGRFVASLATKWETDAFLIKQFQQNLPPVISTIFPYRLLIQPSETQMTGVLHETFHVYQSQVAPNKLDAAEAAYGLENRYWEVDEAMADDWAAELDLLANALAAQTDAEALTFIRQFLTQRAERRQNNQLDDDLIAFERQLEWEEGLAKYVELAMWQAANHLSTYEPLPEMTADPDFKQYQTFAQRWSQEIATMKRQAGEANVVRFYYTGMAQAMLLDRVAPNWHEQIFAEDVWLESLLQTAVP